MISWKRGNLSLLETFVWVLSQKFDGKYLNLEIEKLTKSEKFEKYEKVQSGWKILLCLKSYSLWWIETIRFVFESKVFERSVKFQKDENLKIAKKIFKSRGIKKSVKSYSVKNAQKHLKRREKQKLWTQTFLGTEKMGDFHLFEI